MANETIIINDDLRTMQIPSSIVLLGVESDDDVNKIPFQMPKEYSGFDLSSFQARINYMNANGDGDVYIVDDLEVDGDDPSLMNFTWLVGRNACKFKGDTKFIVCLKKFDENENVVQEFNTTVYTLPVLEGLETTEAVEQQNADIIEYILKLIEESGVVDLSNYYTKPEVNALKLPNPKALTINGTSYDGSAPVEMEIHGGSKTAEITNGEIIHVTDAVADEAVKQLTMYNADGNIISSANIAVSNKNLFRLDLIAQQTISKGITFDKTSNGAIHATGTSTGTYASAQCSIDKNAFVVGETYTISSGKKSGKLYVQLILNYADGTTDYLVSSNAPYTFTLAKEVSSVIGSVQITANNVTVDEWIYPMIELSDTASPFTINTYSEMLFNGQKMPILPDSISNLWANDDVIANIVMEYWNDPTMARVNALEQQFEVTIEHDDELNTVSEHAVKNKVVTAALNEKASNDDLANERTERQAEIAVERNRLNSIIGSGNSLVEVKYKLNDSAWFDEGGGDRRFSNIGNFTPTIDGTTITDFEIISGSWGSSVTNVEPDATTSDGLFLGVTANNKISFEIYDQINPSSLYSWLYVIIKVSNEGSEKDSELIDIRTGYNGKAYGQAGDAVRGQINDVLDRIKATPSNLNLIGGDISSGNIRPASDTFKRLINSEYITAKDDDVIISTDFSKYRFYVWYRNADGTYTGKGWKTSEFLIPKDTAFNIVYGVRGTEPTQLSDEQIADMKNKIKIYYANINVTQTVNDIIDDLQILEDETLSRFNYSAPCGLILGQTRGYAIIDSTAQSINFPNDTIVVGDGASYVLLDSNNNTSCYYGDLGSSAIKIFYQISTGQLVPFKYNRFEYNGLYPQDYILVATLRTNNGQVSINCPYVYDGKLFGVDVGNYVVDYDKIVKSINHKGYSTAPENTLPAYKLSKQKGYNYVECDIRMTSDRVPVLLHDPTINRTGRNADGSAISSTIRIDSITYEQALTYDFGIWKSQEYVGTKIPTLEQFITLCKKLGLQAYIELKSDVNFTAEELTSMVQTIRKAGMIDNVSYISGALAHLRNINTINPYCRIGVIRDADYEGSITTLTNLKTDTNEVFFNCAQRTQAIVDKITGAGFEFETYIVNDVNIAKNLPAGVTGVTTDNLCVGKIIYNNNID